MKNYLLFIFIICTLIKCQPNTHSTVLKVPKNQLVVGHIDSLYSNVLEESRKIWVHIPESAIGNTSDNKYPVLYLLDGPGHFYSVTGMIKQLSTTNGNTLVPEMIVVAIPNTNRSRDLTPTKVDIDFFTGDSIRYSSGGGDKFLDFMEDELIPYIENTYPAASYRTFVGHSFGGLSVINALITRQHVFNNYVSIDPSFWWDNQAYMQMADSILSVNDYDGKALFVGIANTMEEGMKINEVETDTSQSSAHIRSILKFVHSQDSVNNNLNFEWKYYPDDDHGSVPLITEYEALRFLFSWYKLVGIDRFFDPENNTSSEELVTAINNHYNAVSDHFGFQVYPPEQFINAVGYGCMNNNMLDKAVALFDLNIKNYPNSSNVYDSRGDCYLAELDSIKALDYFIKALEVGSNDYSQEKIDMLKKELE